MSININDAVQFLLDNDYAIWYGRKLKLMPKLYEHLNSPEAIHQLPWQDRYIRFIIDAKVPDRLPDSRNGMYPANKFSEEGLKGFRKAIEDGTDYDLLVKATNLYYKSGVRLKVAIGRYMKEGLWRSDYSAVKAAQEEGTIQHFETEQLKDGTHTAWTVG